MKTYNSIQVNSHREMRLENDYYDTDKLDFQNNKMGFRVRGNLNTVFFEKRKYTLTKRMVGVVTRYKF